ncbi:MAG TPA: putative porin [Steroidobacteraceae bacterium]|nr:putative porin [Steroidobacteraceae bacterium]
MKQAVLAAALAAAVSFSTAASAAAPKAASLDDVLARLSALEQRVGEVEARNAVLEKENAELKSHDERVDATQDYLKAQTKDLRQQAATTSVDSSKVKGADWATRIKWKGDLRYRNEGIKTENTPQRTRDRIRARFGFDATVTDTISAGLQIASGADDPRSSNQTLTGQQSRKAIGLDLAYFDWKFAQGWKLTAGKMKYPYVRPGNSLFYDGDLNPEGFAVNFEHGMWFGSAYNFWLTERSTRADSNLAGAQFGARIPMGSKSNLMLAASYYDLGAGQGRCDLFGNAGNGNTTVTSTTAPCAAGNTAQLVFDYNVIMGLAEFNTVVGGRPLQFFADYANNSGADNGLDTAYAAGFLYGKASDARTFEFGAMYQSVQKDALYGQFVDSDFADGRTDGDGAVFRLGYAPVKNWTLNATYFMNTLNRDVGTQLDYGRWQLDFNAKF